MHTSCIYFVTIVEMHTDNVYLYVSVVTVVDVCVRACVYVGMRACVCARALVRVCVCV